MKIGEVYKIIESFTSLSGTYAKSPPYQDELLEITEKNISEMENHLRGGFLQLHKKNSESISFLPDSSKTRTRSSKRNLQPDRG